MSGITGIFNLNGAPVLQDSLDTMVSPMSYWGSDGINSWAEGPVGFTHLMLFNTPESEHELLPAESRSGYLVITAAARIDNRRELLHTLRIPSSEAPTTPDSTLILLAYEKWGESCVDHLLGDWSFAIWDRCERKLFIARDHHGNTGLYYYQSSRHFAFSSCIKGLFPLIGDRLLLNEMRIAQVLTSWSALGPKTAYQDIYRLPPAHCMTIIPEKTTIRRYWCLEDTPSIHLKSDEAYVDAFLDVYAEAVRCRLRSFRPIGATLSGGLDSGSVCALAGRELKKRGESLQAFSSVPIYDVSNNVGKGVFGDETALASATAQFVGNIDHTLIRAEQVSPLLGIRRSLSTHDEPIHAASNQFWMVALMEEVRQRGIGTLLTGQGGNATISWTDVGCLPRLALQGKWVSLLTELCWIAQRNERPLWRLAASQVIRPLVKAAYRPVVSPLHPFKRPWMDYSAINLDFAKALQLSREMYRDNHDPGFYLPINSRRLRRKMIQSDGWVGGCIWHALGAQYAIEVRDPTLDKRVLEFCLSIPNAQYRHKGMGRGLIRRAMDGRLPPEVCWNIRYGRQAADAPQRIRKSIGEVSTAFDSIKQSHLANRMLDLNKMQRVLEEVKAGTIITTKTLSNSGTILLRGLDVGLFLVDFEKGNTA